MIESTKKLLTNFKEHLINKELSDATIEKYLHDVTALFLWLNNREINKTLILSYKELLTKNYSVSSVNSHIYNRNRRHSQTPNRKIRLFDVLTI